jgi:hypothetical protein
MDYEYAEALCLNRKRPWGKRSSVHYGDKTRFEKAKQQADMHPGEVIEVINATNEFLKMLQMVPASDPTIDTSSMGCSLTGKLACCDLTGYDKLNDKRDIVWMKFTKKGFLGVVAVSNDMNFVAPKEEAQLNETNDGEVKTKKNQWKYNTSGILIRLLGEEWDESFVLAFLLLNKPNNLGRGDIECGIGNYLIESKVPILDFYSHRY